MSSLNDKVALVTGSGRGVGQQLAFKLAGEGVAVVVNDLARPAEETVAKIVANGGKAVAVIGSPLDEEFADVFVRTAVETFGGLDIVVNNAGFTWDDVIEDMSDEQWDTIMAMHVTAPFRILRAAQPIISAAVKAEKAHGVVVNRKVVNVSSLAGVFGNAGQVNYSSAQAGVEGLTRALSKEWGRLHVNVNAVAFGVIATDCGEASAVEASRIPLGRAGTLEEAADAVYLLCTPESDYISGQTLVCAGGMVL